MGKEHLKPYQFRPGQSGNPSGKAKSVDRLVKEEIDAAVAEVEDPLTKQKVLLDGWQRIARKLFDLALAGNVQAAKLLLERVGGTPKQIVTVNDKRGAAPVDWSSVPSEERREILDAIQKLQGYTSPTEH